VFTASCFQNDLYIGVEPQNQRIQKQNIVDIGFTWILWLAVCFKIMRDMMYVGFSAAHTRIRLLRTGFYPMYTTICIAGLRVLKCVCSKYILWYSLSIRLIMSVQQVNQTTK